jgi:ketosteroid isomerase-like protein
MSTSRPDDPAELLRFGINEGLDAQNKDVFMEVFADPIEMLQASASEELPAEYLWQEYQTERTALPDLSHDIQQTWQDGNMVFASYTAEATFEAELVLGEELVFEPTGDKMEASGLIQARVKDGQITGFNGYWNQLEAFQQVGIIPSFDDLAD